MPATTLAESRALAFDGPDRDLYLHIGNFTIWFGAVEVRITHLLQLATGVTDRVMFELLIKGMDARVKVERLRRAAKTGGPKLGPNLTARLESFEKQSIPVRNKIAHSSIIKHPREDTFFFSDVVRMPFKVFTGEAHPDPRWNNPDQIAGLRLYGHGLWLNQFSDDLSGAIERGIRASMLEIVRPRSLAHTEYPLRLPDKDPPATPHKPDGKPP